jgi:hypothetical protein
MKRLLRPVQLLLALHCFEIVHVNKLSRTGMLATVEGNQRDLDDRCRHGLKFEATEVSTAALRLPRYVWC